MEYQRELEMGAKSSGDASQNKNDVSSGGQVTTVNPRRFFYTIVIASAIVLVVLIVAIIVTVLAINNNKADDFQSATSAQPCEGCDATAALRYDDINVLVVTDTHSWVSGHRHEPALTATYGDVRSFYDHVKRQTARQKKDLFFVMNGDFNDGTGFSRLPPKTLIPILEKMPWDALTTGNHELYQNKNIDYLRKPGGFIEFWGDRYLTSNVMQSRTGQRLGHPYKILRGEFGAKLLVFGFLYDMTSNADGVTVAKVEDVVQQPWFARVLRAGGFDAVMVLGHMGHDDPLVKVLLAAIRAQVGKDVQVLMETGHTHIRALTTLDSNAVAFEAGHYLDTIGLSSFPKTASTGRGINCTFIDANKDLLATLVGLDAEKFPTPLGAELNAFIDKQAATLSLGETVGCNTHGTYRKALPITDSNSLCRLYFQEVEPKVTLGNNASRVFVSGDGGLRYDLFEGKVTVNDVYTLSPFANSYFVGARAITGAALKQALTRLNAQGWKRWYASPFTPAAENIYELWSNSFDLGQLQRAVKLTNTEVCTVPVSPGHDTTSVWFTYIRNHWKCAD